jgi:glutamate-1-semialdehyde 2,1-aminomutase
MNKFGRRLNKIIPGGAHTYSRGNDQFSSNTPDILIKGKGPYVWSAENTKFLDYGMGLRSISIGYSEKEINEEAYKAIKAGNSLTRPSLIELEAAEMLNSLIGSSDMVKFAKNGSNVTSAAVKLARAYTGRDLVARCAQHPFFSFDDWFIGSTEIPKGIPNQISKLTKEFNFNEIASLEKLIDKYPNKIACVILEPATMECPYTTNETEGCCGKKVCTRANTRKNFLKDVELLCKKHGIVFILDETITGFRWSLGGAQKIFNVKPDLTTFGKAMANGFSVAAICGKKEIMQLGSIERKNQERVFLLSSTHGAEMSGLAAFIATMEFMKKNDVITHFWDYGFKLKEGFNNASRRYGMIDCLYLDGPVVSPFIVTKDQLGKNSFELRTLFQQEMIKNGVLMPWIAISFRHKMPQLKFTINALEKSLEVCSKAINSDISSYLEGPIIKPVFRKYN